MNRIASLLLLVASSAFATVTDPGPRQPNQDGAILPGVVPGSDLDNQFRTGFDFFLGFFGIGQGTGPLYNGTGCSNCHGGNGLSQGGGSPLPNPQGSLGFASKAFSGTKNVIPAFETPNGPALQVILKKSVTGFPAGSVQQIFTIAGAVGVPASCTITQPNFVTEQAAGDFALRQPSQVLGTGLIDALSASTLTESLNSTATQRAKLGIGGQLNLVNDQVGKFGWKAQVASLTEFTALAFGRELGVTNVLFPIKNDPNDPAGNCVLNAIPEDPNPLLASPFQQSNVANVTVWEMLTDQPHPQVVSQQPADVSHGQAVFSSIGCSLCHTPSLVTAKATLAPLSQVQANLYSDLALHHMGACLADGLTQGEATGDMFRTSPLWGVGERNFFLHDGRETNIINAVKDHFCAAQNPYPASEANGVLNAFNALTPGDQQAVIDFLRSR